MTDITKAREAFEPIRQAMVLATVVPVLADYKINGEPALLVRLADLTALSAAFAEQARPQPEGLETTAEIEKLRNAWNRDNLTGTEAVNWVGRLLRDRDRLLSRPTAVEAVEAEREACARYVETRDWWMEPPLRKKLAEGIRALALLSPAQEEGKR